MTLSAIIITSGRVERLQLTVAGCLAQQPPVDELIIVDDAGDLRPASLPSSAGVVPRCVTGERRGRAAARNTGARQASGDVLLFLDDDVVINMGFAALHRAAQIRSPGICRGRIRDLIAAAVVRDFAVGAPGFPPLEPRALAAGQFAPDRYRQVSSALERAVDERFLGGEARLPAWLAACGANFSIARRDWLRLGGQEERFGVRWGCEDLELSLRAVREGVSLAFVPDAVAYHLSHPQPARWAAHAHNLALLAALHPLPEVAALGALLGPEGSIRGYLDALGARQ